MLPTVDVLLPAYNGSTHIGAQIESILHQNYAGLLRLYVRDDGSDDATVSVVQQLQQLPTHPQRELHLLQKASSEPRGLSYNVSALLHHVQADRHYVALADQDDMWQPDKLRLQIEAIQEAEATHGTTVPMLVFTDLTVVDAQLQPLHPSMWKLQRLDPRWTQKWQHCLVQNAVSGCTTLLNAAAVSKVLPIPQQHGIVHDHWMATAVSYYGQVIPLHTQTVLYRQHDKNVIGAQAFTMKHALTKLKHLLLIQQRSQAIAMALGQPQTACYLIIKKLHLGVKRFF